MQRYAEQARTRDGRAIRGASVSVVNAYGVLATIYSDNGFTPQANPIITGLDGEYAFYAPNGRYSLSISATGYTAETVPGIVLHDPADDAAAVPSVLVGAGDGVTDDTTANNAALAAVPVKTHRLASTLNVPAAALVAGRGNPQGKTNKGTILKVDHAGSGLLLTDADGATVRDLKISGLSTTAELVKLTGGTYGASIENVRLEGGLRAMTVVDSFYTRVRNITTNSFSGDAVVYLGGATTLAERNDATEFVQAAISPGAGNRTTDCIVAEGTTSSHKFVEVACAFGRHGLVVRGLAGAESSPGHYYWTGGGMENQEGNCLRLEEVNHFNVGGPAYFSNDGDASICYIGPNAANINIQGGYFRGAGRHTFDVHGKNINIAAASIYNGGRYSASRGLRNIVGLANNGAGAIRVTIQNTDNGSTIRQQPIEDGDWVVLAGNTTPPNGEWKVTKISDTVYDLQGSTYSAAYAVAGTIRSMTAHVRVGPSAGFVTIAPGQLGGTTDGSNTVDYDYIIESNDHIKWTLNNLGAQPTRGRLKYTPTTPPTNVYEWTDRWFYERFTTTGAAVAGYTTRRIPPGIYAIVALEMKCSAVGTGAEVRGVHLRNNSAYSETGSLTVTQTAWHHRRLTQPELVRIDSSSGANEVGYRVVNANGTTDLQVNVVLVRMG